MAELPWGALSSMMDDLTRAWGSVDEVQQRTMAVTGTGESDDGLIKALVGPRGHLVDLAIDHRALRFADPASLAAEIVAATKRAVADASRQTRAIVDESLPADLSAGQLGGERLRALLDGHDADVVDPKAKAGDDG